jgi:hypothetical protein
MAEEPKSYRREFWSSATHALMGLCTLGAAALTASPGRAWPLLVGVAAYALGWIYVPDMPFFRRSVDKKRAQQHATENALELDQFRARHALLVSKLSSARMERYSALLAVCQDIERASSDASVRAMGPLDPNDDLRLKKLEELAWTYLRLLSIEETQERFLEVERRDNLPRELENVTAEERKLAAEVAELQKTGPVARVETKQRLLESCRERLSVLIKRVDRVEETRSNLALIASEQERLVLQVKLIRADAVATKNAQALSDRIDATVEHLNETNKWLAGLEEFKDLVGGLPETPGRMGFGTFTATPGAPPPIPENAARRARPRTLESGGNG